MSLVEILIAVLVLAIAIAAILGAQLAQLALSEHARNIQLAIGDANRVLEEIRKQHTHCAIPSAVPPGGQTSWNAWLLNAGAGGGINLALNLNELVVVTCRSENSGVFCPKDQIGSGEWHYAASPAAGGTQEDAMRITVAICWSHKGRILGECKWSPGNVPPLIPDDTLTYPGSDTPNVIDSPAMATTLVTCRAT